MKAKPHPEQGFRACLGILRLCPQLRLRHASRRPADAAMTSAQSPTARSNRSCSMGSIVPTPTRSRRTHYQIQHRNIRGTGYYH